MYINIEQNTSLVENVNIKIMSKLYELMTGTVDPYDEENLLDHNSNIVGSVNISYIYDYQYNFITHEYNNCFINYRDTYLYIKDPYVKQVLLDNNFGDGIGVLTSIATTTTTIPNFSGTQSAYNNEIVSFDELQYFRNVTSLTRNFNFIGNQFESIDLKNIVNLNGTFYWCGIHNVNNSQNINSIPDQCFELNYNLTGLDVSNVKLIGWNGIINTQITELHFGGYSDIVLKSSCLSNNTKLREITGLENMTLMPGSLAFSGCNSLEELHLDNITGDITQRICNDCKSLTTFYAPNAGGTKINAEAFYNCTNLKNLTLDFTNISIIGNSAFYGCTSLTSIDISNCTSLGYSVFYNCKSLTSLSLPLITEIPSSLCEYCSSLTSLDFPSFNSNSISNRAFDGCSSLTSITGIDDAKIIGDYTFYECSSLTSINIKPTSVGVGGFGNCTTLQNIDLSEVQSLSDNAFYGCKALTSIDLTSLTTVSGRSQFRECSNLQSVKWSDTLDNIPGYMFTYDNKLESITNISNVKTISAIAFQNCNLISLSLPNVETIEQQAFTYNRNLKSLSIPKIKYLGSQCFAASHLTSINPEDFKHVIDWGWQPFNTQNSGWNNKITCNKLVYHLYLL